MFHYSFASRSNIQSNHSPFFWSQNFGMASLNSFWHKYVQIYQTIQFYISPLNYCVLCIGVREYKFQDHMNHTNSDKSWKVKSSRRVHLAFQLPIC
jgi:hypothetical protein